ncbi:MAG: glycosyltransferase family 4 protein [Candidatus Omnitrophota bacterium]|nr:glycosyltransferase family 4 protein [Candidatus Omnitrophota bacterium]
MNKGIRVGYLNLLNKSFLSAITIEKEFLNLLSRYLKVVIIDTGSNISYCQKLNKLNIDYLFIDIKHFNHEPFILREKGKFDMPFIIMLHSITAWAESLAYIIPLIRKEDIIVAPSSYAKDSFFRITRKFKVWVIPHCLDIVKIQAAVSGINNDSDKKIITYMGTLTENKGVDILLRSMPGIIREIKEVQLNIIGPLSGDSVYSDISPYYIKLKRLVRELKLTNYVEFKGLQLGLDKYKILARSDIFINPSLIPSETFGVVNIEALACGVPVVCSRYNAFREVIKENRNGFFVDVESDAGGKVKIDENQLISLTLRLLKDQALNHRMKIQAKKEALEYDYRKIMPKLIRLLKRKVSARARNRWNLIKNKKTPDFKDLYEKEMLFFIKHLGWGSLTYSEIDRMQLWKNIYARLFKYLSGPLVLILCLSIHR